MWSGHEGSDIAKLLISSGERLAALCLDDPAVDEAMKTLHRGLGLHAYGCPINGEDTRDWRTIWRASDDSVDFQFPSPKRQQDCIPMLFMGCRQKTNAALAPSTTSRRRSSR